MYNAKITKNSNRWLQFYNYNTDYAHSDKELFAHDSNFNIEHTTSKL